MRSLSEDERALGLMAHDWFSHVVAADILAGVPNTPHKRGLPTSHRKGHIGRAILKLSARFASAIDLPC